MSKNRGKEQKHRKIHGKCGEFYHGNLVMPLFHFMFQEVEPRCGETLCRLFPPDDNVDLRAIALKAKRARREAHAERGGAQVFSPRDRGGGGGGPGIGGPSRLGLFIGLNSCGGRSIT